MGVGEEEEGIDVILKGVEQVPWKSLKHQNRISQPRHYWRFVPNTVFPGK